MSLPTKAVLHAATYPRDPKPGAPCNITIDQFNDWLAEELRQAKSDAWHEGFEAGWEEHENPGPFVNDIWDAKTPNPYRKQP